MASPECIAPNRRSQTGLLALSLLLIAGLSGCAQLQNALPKPDSGTTSATASSGASKSTNATLKSLMDTGNGQAKSGNWTAAVASFNQASTLNPDYAPAHVQLGWANAELKNWDEAQKHLVIAIRLDPDNSSAHANLGWVYAEKQKWADAQDEAKKAIDLDPKNAYAHATLAWAYQETGQNQLAVSEYESSLALKPGLANSHFAVGMLYCNQGLGPRAKEHLEKLRPMSASSAADLQTRISKGCYPPKK